MDLGKVVANKLAVIKLYHPATGDILETSEKEPKEMTISLFASHTKEYKAASRKLAKVMKKKFGHVKMHDLTEDQMNDIDSETADFLADITEDFHLYMNGELVKFSKAEALKIYSDEQYYWIRDQVQDGLKDARNFMMA